MMVHSYGDGNLSWQPHGRKTDREIADHMRARGCTGTVSVAHESDARYDINLATGRAVNKRTWTTVAVCPEGKCRDLMDWRPNGWRGPVETMTHKFDDYLRREVCGASGHIRSMPWKGDLP